MENQQVMSPDGILDATNNSRKRETKRQKETPEIAEKINNQKSPDKQKRENRNLIPSRESLPLPKLLEGNSFAAFLHWKLEFEK